MASESRPTSRTVLLIEDDIDIRESLVFFLESERFELVAKSNGKEALEYLLQCPALPGAILLDLMMPVMSGYELLAALAEAPRSDLKSLPIILLSASNDIQSVAQTYGTRFIKKPIHLDSLLEVLAPFRD